MKRTTGLIDSHCHIFDTYYGKEIPTIVQNATDAGINHMLNVGCDLTGSKEAVDLAETYEPLYAAVGIHPHEASSVTVETIESLHAMAALSKKVVAIGETGLDYFRNRSPKVDQQNAFRLHIELAIKLDLPLIIHNRDANDDCLMILREMGLPKAGGVMHCFSGDVALAKEAIDLGLHISLAGPVTYPKNEVLRQVAAIIPDDRLLIETDAPYLSPQKFRGKRNEPALIHHTAATIAEIRGISTEDISRIVAINCQRLFGFGHKPDETEETIAYRIRNSLYLNITNRCTNACTFCAKFKEPIVKGHQLHLEDEPGIDQVLAAIERETEPFDEVVFCGFGEPLLRPDIVVGVAEVLKERGIKTRINTDGQANLVHGQDITPQLAGLIDAISISLNAPDAETYQKLCQSEFGSAAYPAVIDFIKAAKEVIPNVTVSMVTVPGVDVEACKAVAKELGVTIRIREYNVVG